MSFGFGVGDFLAAANLAISIRKRYSDAPKEFNNLFADLRNLTIVLQDADILAVDSNLDSAHIKQLLGISETCKSVLNDIEKFLYKHLILGSTPVGLGQQAKRSWQRLKWSSDDAKDLRSRLTASIDMLNVFISTSNSISTLEIRDKLDEVVDQQELERREQLLRWISDIDHEAIFQDALSSRQEITSWQWFLKTEEVSHWIDGKNNTVLCTGAPGIGKTVMTSVLIDSLKSRAPIGGNEAVVHVFFNYNRKEQQRPHTVLSSILAQLLRAGITMPTTLKQQIILCREKGSMLSFDQLLDGIQTCLYHFHNVFIILDALDECLEDHRYTILDYVFDWQKSRNNTKLFATSRPLPAIIELFSVCPRIILRANDEDIRTFLKDKTMRMNIVRKDPSLAELIIAEIIKAVDGVFLLARLHMDSLQSKRTPKTLRAALNALPHGSTAYDVAYEQAIDRIKSQPIECHKQAMEALLWIVCTTCELTTAQLQHALAIEENTSDLDSENKPDIDDVVSVCIGLVEVDIQTNIVRLVHYSAREYFARHQEQFFPNSDKKLAKYCIRYITFEIFAAGPCEYEDLNARRRQHPLYSYAASQWGVHGHKGKITLHDARSVLMDEEKLAAAMQMTPAYDGYPHGKRRCTALHAVAFFCLEEIVSALLPDCEDPNAEDYDGQTALDLACQYTNSVTLLNIFLKDQRIDLSAREETGDAPQHILAKESKLEMLFALLSDPKADPNLLDGFNRTVLHQLAISNDIPAVKALLLRDQKMETGPTADSRRSNDLGASSQLNAAQIAVDFNLIDRYGHTALSSISRDQGFTEMIELLCADPRVDLQLAVQSAINHVEMANLTILIQAALRRHEKYEDSKRADVAINGQSSTADSSTILDPLKVALSGCLFRLRAGDAVLLKFLLKAGADATERDENGTTVMNHFVQTEDDDLVATLLDWEESNSSGDKKISQNPC